MTGNLKPSDIMSLGDGMHGDGGYLWLRVKGAARSWVVRGPRDERGVKREAGLGSAERVSLALARKERDKLVEQWRNGKDPIAERRAEREARANRKTFGEVARLKIEAMKPGWRTSFEGRTSTLDTWTRNMEVDCAPIAAKAIDEIAVDDIKRIVAPYWDRGHDKAGRDFVKRVEAVFNFAIAHGWRTAANPAAWKVFKEIWPRKIGKKVNHAALPWRDVPEFVNQLRASDAVAARVIEFAILTATRSGETRGARWSEFDLEAKTWTIPAERMKKGEEHTVPLSDQAMALLARVKAEGAEGDYVFPGYVNDGSRRTRDLNPVPNASVWKLTKRLGGDVTTHGFRSTFTDWGRTRNIESDRVLDLCLAHRKSKGEVSQSFDHYARETLFERRRPVMQAWADFIDGASNVVEFKRSA